MRVHYIVMSIPEKDRRMFRGGFVDRADAVAEARRICDAEDVQVLVVRDDGPPLRFSPTRRASSALH
jgi:hypothetical protein